MLRGSILSPSVRLYRDARNLHIDCDWACSTALTSTGIKINRQHQSFEERSLTDEAALHIRPFMLPSKPCICVNSNSVEDTDLFFMLKEFPPPAHLTSRFAYKEGGTRRSFMSKRKGTFALFQWGAWEQCSQGSVFTPVVSGGEDTNNEDAAGCAWASFTKEMKTVAASHAPPRTSIHERLELVLKGSTDRLPSHLFISQEAVRTMKLSLVPDAQRFAFCSEIRCPSASPSPRRLRHQSYEQGQEALYCGSLEEQHFVSVQDIIQLGRSSSR
jgi:hypothetical protein